MSTAALVIKTLEEAGLVITQPLPGIRGPQKLSGIKAGMLTIDIKPSDQTLDSLGMFSGDCFFFRTGVKADAEYVGGINLFGEHFGNTNQHVNIRINYTPASF